MSTAGKPKEACHYIYSSELSVPVWVRPFFLDQITLAISNEIVGEHAELHRCPLIRL